MSIIVSPCGHGLWLLIALLVHAGTVAPLPAATLHVDPHHARAADGNDGSADAPFKTIGAAAAVARRGDTVLVHPGVYREHVAPGREGGGVTYRSLVRHAAVVKGSDLWTPEWQPVQGMEGVSVAALEPGLFAGRRNPYHIAITVVPNDQKPPARPLPKDAAFWTLTLGQLFIDGQCLTQANDMEQLRRTPGTWLVGRRGDEMFLHPPGHVADITGAVVELTVRDRVFAPSVRGLADITIEGFVFEHCGNDVPFPQRGMVDVRSGRDWVIRDNVIRFAKTIGLAVGSEHWKPQLIPDTPDDQRRLMTGGGHQVLDNLVQDNGLCGIAGWHTRGTVIRGNVVRRNNRLGFEARINTQWEESAGIKVHAFADGVIEGNFVIDNDGAGIWVDNGYLNARVSRNLVINSLGKGIFIELGEGRILVDHNIVAYSRKLSDFFGGDGIYTHDASDVVIAHNLLCANARYGVMSRVVTERKTGKPERPVETSNHQITGNLFIGNQLGAICMPFAGPRSRNNRSDHNVFVGPARMGIHDNHRRVDRDVILNAYRKASSESPAAEPRPAAEAWFADPRTDLAVWRRMMAMDEHSVDLPAARMFLTPGDASFSVTDADPRWSMPTPAVEGVTRNYWGDLLGDAPTAGPLGPIAPGPQRWILWPIP